MTINELRLSIRQTLLIINNEDDESIHNILDLFFDVLNDKQLKQIEDTELLFGGLSVADRVTSINNKIDSVLYN